MVTASDGAFFVSGVGSVTVLACILRRLERL